MNPLKTAGYIYCIYNESFKSYGENTFKLGRTGNLNNRLNNYTTYYISPCKFLFTSLDCERKFKDCIKAERILFYILRKYRVSNKREFFSCDISTPGAGVKAIWDRPKQPIPLPEGQLSFFATTEFKPECCPNTYSTSTGCACMDLNSYNFLRERGGNNVPYSEF